MMLLKQKYLALTIVFWAFFMSNCIQAKSAVVPKREFRGAWITTLMNIDFPSKPALANDVLKDEVVQLLDFLQGQGLNALFFQVRPTADAFYKSSFEPTSKYLTGVSGSTSDDVVDVLDFVVEECHSRAMECHAWINPFRALANPDSISLANYLSSHNNDSLKFIKYGKNLYFDPGMPQNRDHVLRIVSEIVQNYAIDGIHFDDYFYPYKLKGETFYDTLSFAMYGDNEKVDEWRRSNINDLIKRTSDTLALRAPLVKFGISPFGVWRNKSEDPRGSATKAGTTSYDVVYADVLQWIEKGWIDYVAPQLYWPIGNAPADYKVLAEWWSKQCNRCNLYIGQSIFKVDGGSNIAAWKDGDEIVHQIELNRELNNVNGSVFFNASSLVSNKLGVTDKIRRNCYPTMALTPLMPWKLQTKCTAPKAATVESERDGLLIQWSDTNDSNRASYVIYRVEGSKSIDLENAENICSIVSSRSRRFLDRAVQRGKKYTYVISSVSKSGIETYQKTELTIKFR